MSGHFEWADRFVRRGMVEPEQLLANPRNWRVHPSEQEAALEQALDTVGWVGDVIAQDGSDMIVDGHERVEMAISRGELVPVSWYDLTDEECDYVLATRDAIGALAVTDKSKLAALMDDVQAPQGVVAQMLDNLVHGTGIAVPGGSQAGGGASTAGAGTNTPQGNAQTPSSVRVVQIYCSDDALEAIRDRLDEWRAYPGIQRIAVS